MPGSQTVVFCQSGTILSICGTRQSYFWRRRINMNKGNSQHLLADIAFIAMMFAPAMGQVSTGPTPLGSFSGGPDVTNLGNLNVHYAIPILSKRGRSLPFNYGLSFDSSVWFPAAGTWVPVTNWGWNGPSDAFTSRVPLKSTLQSCTDPYTHQRFTYTVQVWGPYTDGFGVTHQIFARHSDGDVICDPGINEDGFATDGSGYEIVPNGFVIAPSGRIIKPTTAIGFGSGTITDTNGNQITANAGTFTDTLGMNVLTASGGAPNPLVFTYHDSSNTARTVTVNYSTYTVKTNFGCSGIAEYGPTSKIGRAHV